MNLFINGRFTTQTLSGVQRFSVEIAKALQARDPDYVFLTPPGGSILWPGAHEIGIRQGQSWEQVDLPRATAGGLLINLGNTGPLMARRQLIVIHDAGVFSTPEAYSRKFRLWYKFLQTALIKRNAAIVTVSEFSRREILHYLPANPAQVRVMSEGGDHMQRVKAKNEILTRHGLESRHFVLSVGTSAAHKNLMALEFLGQSLKGRGMQLVIAGGMRSAAFQIANLPQSAYYIGRVDDSELKALYREAGCFVFPSCYEGFGLPPIEAMTCGCPVVASDISALREVCADAVQYCNPDSPEDIATQVLEVLTSQSKRQDLCEAGKAHAATLTWARAAATLDEFVKELPE